MWRPRGCVWTTAAALPILASCRSPTEITVSVTTDVDCTMLQGTSIAVGSPDSLASALPSATTLTCDGGNIGTLVVVPSGAGAPEIAIRVVTGVSETPDACDEDGYKGGCIVARRALHFIAHTPLTVPVVMRGDCQNMPCDAPGPLSTCVQGRCVPAAIPDPASCEGSGCGEGVLSDAGTPGPSDAGGDGSLEGGADGAAMVDATLDASSDVGGGDGAADAGPGTMVLLGMDPAAAYGVAYSDGGWGSPVNLGAGNGTLGGGVTYLADDRALAVARQSVPPDQAVAAVFAGGSWGMLSPEGAPVFEIGVSAPVASGDGAFFARIDQNDSVFVDTFTATTSQWATLDSGAMANAAPLTVAATAAGNPLVLFNGGANYVSSVFDGGAWSAPTPVQGVAASGNGPTCAAVLRSNVADEIVAAFLVPTDGGQTATLQAATYSGGAWAAGPPVANDLLVGAGIPFSLAALPDGRVWVAYVAPGNGVNAASLEGSAWTALRSVPTARAYGTYPLSLARGIGGHVVELAFIDSSGTIQWTSLLDESTWAWSTPVPVAASASFALVSIASR